MRSRLLAVGFGAFILLAGLQPAAADQKADMAAIKKLVETEMEGASTHDIEKTMSIYAPGNDIVLFDAAPPNYVGNDAVRAAFLKYFSGFPGKPEASMADLRIDVSGDLGYAHRVETWKMKRPDGTVFTTVQRVSNVYKRYGNKWLCVHEHASVPLDYFQPTNPPKAQ